MTTSPEPRARRPRRKSTVADTARATETWFLRHGLPYFVPEERAAVRRALGRSRMAPLAGLGLLVATAVGLLRGWWGRDVSGGVSLGLLVLGLLAAGYASSALRVRPIAGWALSHVFRSLGLMVPLATRALPLLLLFVTFLFINTEVWMVASSLDTGLLTMAVMLFVLMAAGFLLVRLPEEIDAVDDEIMGNRLVAACKQTPVAGRAPELVESIDFHEHVEVHGYEKANLVLVLLLSQAVQVLLLSLAVLGFFLVFGGLVMQPAVVHAWLGHPPHDLAGGLSLELVKVSVFLAGFCGLYFTVYAVTDGTYREQFFTSVTSELERAVAVRAVYQVLPR
jgi:hypothetical protein